MEQAQCPVEFKALGETGMFEALVSVFNNVDFHGDRVLPGAFRKSLTRWRKSGRPIPVTWSHDWSLEGYIGEVDPGNAKETAEGLYVKGQLDLEDPGGAKAHKLMKRGLVNQFSFSYEPIKSSRVEDDEDGFVRELQEVEIIEIGPTMAGANPETRLIGVKANGKAEVDNSDWDGSAAMSACDSASCYRAICAGERSEGDPDERQHWALPHHKRPGAAPNANGVRNALARLEQTEGLKNPGAARSHLEAHMKAISASSRLASAVTFHLDAKDRELLEDIRERIDVLLTHTGEASPAGSKANSDAQHPEEEPTTPRRRAVALARLQDFRV